MKKTPPKTNEETPGWRGDGNDQKRVNAAHVKRMRRCVRNLRRQSTLPSGITMKQEKELAKMEKWV